MVNICLTPLIKFWGRSRTNYVNTTSEDGCWLFLAPMALSEEAGNEPGKVGHFTGTELDRPARRHRYEPDARHFLRRIRAFGGTGAQPFEDCTAELLNNNSADDIHRSDQPGPLGELAHQMDGAGKAGPLAVDLRDLANKAHRPGSKQKGVEQHRRADRVDCEGLRHGTTDRRLRQLIGRRQ